MCGILICTLICHVFCVSEASANKFSVIFYLLLARSNATSPWSFQRFRQTLWPVFIWILQQVKIFPIDTHCKNPSTFDVNESWRFSQWGYMGKFFICCRIRLIFRLRVCLKRSYNEASLSFIGQEVKIVSPKIRLHWRLRRTVDIMLTNYHL